MIVTTRSCRLCGDQSMKPKSRDWTGMETTITYECPSCANIIELNALSQAGLMSALGLIVLAIVSGIMMESPGPWDMSDYLIYGGVLLACAYVPLSILYPHWRYPVSNQSKKINSDFRDTSLLRSHSDPVRRRIIKFDRHGFWRGFLTPILFIAIVLMGAALIGMLNFYVFQ
jgi:hypothetical protein